MSVAPYKGGQDWWVSQCGSVADWLNARKVEVREAIWVLPQAAHVALAQAAWAQGPGGWMPRILPLSSLQHTPGPGSEGLSLDPALDRWRALALLRSVPWGRDLAARDFRAFDALAARLQALARAFAQTAWAQSQEDRADWLTRARSRLLGTPLVAEEERMLSRLALEWAVLHEDSWVDEALALRPAALAVHEPAFAVASMSFAQHLLRAARRLGLPARRYAVCSPELEAVSPPRMQVCEDFEDEAMHTRGASAESLEGPRHGAVQIQARSCGPGGPGSAIDPPRASLAGGGRGRRQR